MRQKQNQEWVRRVSMGNSWHSEPDIVTPRSRAEAVTQCFVFSSGDSKSWSRPQELGLDTINLVVNEIFADFLTPDRLLFLHDLLLAHCLELHICNQVFANILCCENGPARFELQSKVCTRIHKHRHVNYSTIVWEFPFSDFKCFDSQFVRSLAVNKIRFNIKIQLLRLLKALWSAAATFMGHQKSGDMGIF